MNRWLLATFSPSNRREVELSIECRSLARAMAHRSFLLFAFALALLLGTSRDVYAEGSAPAGHPSADFNARTAKPKPSVYLGWRLFEAKCATCHGSDASGTDRAPNVLTRIGPMSEEAFVATVLRRYKWLVPAGEAMGENAAREALIQDILKGRNAEYVMPAWGNEPSVMANVLDLYAYLRGRANGDLKAGRPAPGTK